MTRDLTRADLKAILRRGLAQTGGNYKGLVNLFNMPPSDYRRFLSFLRKHECYVRLQRGRADDSGPSPPQKAYDLPSQSPNPRENRLFSTRSFPPRTVHPTPN